jgi:proteasome lid subunit RPN8/RPN11
MPAFMPKRTDSVGLLYRERPRTADRFVRYRANNDGFEAIVGRDVLELMRKHMELRAPDETIGILAGRSFRDSIGTYTLVVALEPALPSEASATPGHVSLSAQGDSAVRRRLFELEPTLEPVGWFHSHPRFEPQYSGEDRQNQSTWTSEHHLGIVISGCRKRWKSMQDQFGVYRGPESERLSADSAVMVTKTLGDPPLIESGPVTSQQNILNRILPAFMAPISKVILGSPCDQEALSTVHDISNTTPEVALLADIQIGHHVQYGLLLQFRHLSRIMTALTLAVLLLVISLAVWMWNQDHFLVNESRRPTEPVRTDLSANPVAGESSYSVPRETRKRTNPEPCEDEPLYRTPRTANPRLSTPSCA